MGTHVSSPKDLMPELLQAAFKAGVRTGRMRSMVDRRVQRVVDGGLRSASVLQSNRRSAMADRDRHELGRVWIGAGRHNTRGMRRRRVLLVRTCGGVMRGRCGARGEGLQEVVWVLNGGVWLGGRGHLPRGTGQLRVI